MNKYWIIVELQLDPFVFFSFIQTFHDCLNDFALFIWFCPMFIYAFCTHMFRPHFSFTLFRAVDSLLICVIMAMYLLQHYMALEMLVKIDKHMWASKPIIPPRMRKVSFFHFWLVRISDRNSIASPNIAMKMKCYSKRYFCARVHQEDFVVFWKEMWIFFSRIVNVIIKMSPKRWIPSTWQTEKHTFEWNLSNFVW